MKPLLFCLLLSLSALCASHTSVSQSHKIDSLWKALRTEKEDTNKINTLNDLGFAVYLQGDYKVCDSLIHAALQLGQKLDFKKGMSIAYRRIGFIYEAQGNYPTAQANEFKALELAKEANYKEGMGNAYTIIGLIYSDQNNYTEALNYQLQALKLHGELNDKDAVANNYGNMGSIYKSLRNYDMALECLEKSLHLHTEESNAIGMANNTQNIGNVYEAKKDYTKAMDYYQRALEIAKKNGFKKNVDELMGSIGAIYLNLKNYKLARHYIDSSLLISKELGVKGDIKEDYAYLSNVDSATHDYKGSLKNYQLSIAYRDSLVNEAFTKAQMNLEFAQKQAIEKADQEKKDGIAAQEKKRQLTIRNSLIAGFLLVLLVVFLLYSRYRTKEKTASLLEEQNKLISDRNIELERLSIVASETENLILILDAEGRVEWANESFVRVNGITVAELKKQKGETIFQISNNPEIKNIVNTAITEKRSVVYESLNENKEGKITWESSTLTPIFDTSTGKLKKLVIVDSDITQRKQDEEIIEQKNKDITDSIKYAKRLQEAILPPITEINKLLPDSFVLYRPKDIVAGDFYWMEQEGDVILVAAADCTGHGVPGAMVSVVCSNALKRALNEFKMRDTGKMLDKTRELVIETFEKSESDVQDGMDISLCAINLKENFLEWSGANNPLWYVRKGELFEIGADKQPVGKQDKSKPFKSTVLQLEKDDVLYLFTDGFADQFGGPDGKKYKYKQLEETLTSISSQPLAMQKGMLEKNFEDWKGKLDQIDDVLIIGIRV